jgi:hypothetical protein
MPGRDQGLAAVVIWCLSASSSARGPGAHPAGPAGEVRSGAAGTGEQMEELLVFVAGAAARTLPELAGQACCPGRLRRLPVVPGRLAPRLAARQPDPDLRDC